MKMAHLVLGTLLIHTFSTAIAGLPGSQNEFNVAAANERVAIINGNKQLDKIKTDIANLQAEADSAIKQSTACLHPANCQASIKFYKEKADKKLAEIDKLTKESASLKSKVDDLSKMTKFNQGETKLVINDLKLDATMLFADVNLTASVLKDHKADLKMADLALDNTLLGQYTKYAIEKATKKDICGQVKTCMKETSSKVSNLNKSVEDLTQSFEQWKKEDAKKAAPVTPASPAPKSTEAEPTGT